MIVSILVNFLIKTITKRKVRLIRNRTQVMCYLGKIEKYYRISKYNNIYHSSVSIVQLGFLLMGKIYVPLLLVFKVFYFTTHEFLNSIRTIDIDANSVLDDFS